MKLKVVYKNNNFNTILIRWVSNKLEWVFLATVETALATFPIHF